MTAVKTATLVLLWVVTGWRLPGALRSARQRALWLSFACIAAATTLGVPAVAHAVDDGTGVRNLSTLGKNLLGITGSAAILDFVTAIARPAAAARARRPLLAATGSALVLLTVLFTATPRRTEADDFFQANLGSVPGTAYCVVFLGCLGLAMTVATWLFWGSSRHAGAAWLRFSLRLLGTGSAFGAAYSAERTAVMLGGLLHLHVGGSGAERAADLLEYTAISLIILGSSLPAVGALWRAVRDWRTLRAVRPLWSSLTEAVPDVVLDTRLAGLGPRMRLHRAVIEIRDAALVLTRHLPPEARDAARHAAEQAEADPERRAALAEALWLHAARTARLAGTPAAAAGPRAPAAPTAIDFDFEAEVGRLRAVSAHYRSTAAADLAAHLAAAPRTGPTAGAGTAPSAPTTRQDPA